MTRQIFQTIPKLDPELQKELDKISTNTIIEEINRRLTYGVKAVKPNIGDVSQISYNQASAIEEQLKRLNDNIERWLESQNIKPRRLRQVDEVAEDKFSSFIGNPVSEFEQALKEHAELTGKQLKTDDNDPV